MSGEMELDPKAVDAAAFFVDPVAFGTMAFTPERGGIAGKLLAQKEVRIRTERAIRAYLKAAGLVSVPVIGRKG